MLKKRKCRPKAINERGDMCFMYFMVKALYHGGRTEGYQGKIWIFGADCDLEDFFKDYDY